MKRLIYLTYLGLLVFILAACEKEVVAPATADTTSFSLTDDADARKACAIYSYRDKLRGVIDFGLARPELLLVGFRNDLTMERREQILSQYSAFLATDGETYVDSGILTIVKLKPGSTCNTVASMIANLQSKPQVRFAAPMFNPEDPTLYEWRALTNEVIVTMKNARSGADLALLCQQNNTVIVAQLAPDTYIVSTSKNSAGDALQISTLFNKSAKVYNAEPNLIYQYLPMMKKDNTVTRKYAAKRMELEAM